MSLLLGLLPKRFNAKASASADALVAIGSSLVANDTATVGLDSTVNVDNTSVAVASLTTQSAVALVRTARLDAVGAKTVGVVSDIWQYSRMVLPSAVSTQVLARTTESAHTLIPVHLTTASTSTTSVIDRLGAVGDLQTDSTIGLQTATQLAAVGRHTAQGAASVRWDTTLLGGSTTQLLAASFTSISNSLLGVGSVTLDSASEHETGSSVLLTGSTVAYVQSDLFTSAYADLLADTLVSSVSTTEELNQLAAYMFTSLPVQIRTRSSGDPRVFRLPFTIEFSTTSYMGLVSEVLTTASENANEFVSQENPATMESTERVVPFDCEMAVLPVERV